MAIAFLLKIKPQLEPLVIFVSDSTSKLPDVVGLQ